MDDEPRSGKRDRLARLTRVVALLRAHPDGMTTQEIASRIGVSVRTVYRDLHAIEGEIGIPLWSEGGRWGLAAEGFLPPLKLTLDEAMAVVLSARLMVRYADKYDPDLALGVREARRGPAAGARASTSTGRSTSSRGIRATSGSAATSGC